MTSGSDSGAVAPSVRPSFEISRNALQGEMRFSEENGAEIDAAGMECRLKVRLLPAQAEGVAPVAGRNHLQVRLQLRRIRICARAPRDVLLHPQVRRKELPGGGRDTE